MDKVITTNIRVPASLKKAIEAMAREEGRSFNNMVNKILKEVVKQ
jgi:predicted HicB family RNase H-like nuclease